MVCRLGGPEAEAVVVLHYSDTASHACSLGCLEPLLGVGSGCRRKGIAVFVSIAPLATGIGVHAIVEEGVELGLLPLELARMWHGVYGRRLIIGVGQCLLGKS